MQFEQSDILIKLSDGYIENIIVYNDEGYLDNDTIRKYYFCNENPIWKYHSKTHATKESPNFNRERNW